MSEDVLSDGERWKEAVGSLVNIGVGTSSSVSLIHGVREMGLTFCGVSRIKDLKTLAQWWRQQEAETADREAGAGRRIRWC